MKYLEASHPERDEWAKAPMAQVPMAKTTSYPGRPNWCGGALLTDPANPSRKPHRVPCSSEAIFGYGLCASCAGREVEMRRAMGGAKR